MSSNLLHLNPSKTEFIIIGLSAQIKKIPDLSIHLSDNSSSTTFTSDAPVHNLSVTFDPHLSFSNHLTNLSRSCFMHIRDLRRIRPMLDSKTASTIAPPIAHPATPSSSISAPPKHSVSSSSKILLHGLLLERPGIIISLLSFNHFTG